MKLNFFKKTFPLRPNCLLTHYPFALVGLKKSHFKDRDIASFIEAHGYPVFGSFHSMADLEKKLKKTGPIKLHLFIFDDSEGTPSYTQSYTKLVTLGQLKTSPSDIRSHLIYSPNMTTLELRDRILDRCIELAESDFFTP